MEKAAKSSSGGSAGPGSECEGEDQDESSSSSSPEALHQGVRSLNLDDSADTKDPEDHLREFRQQWQQELGGSPSPQPESPCHEAAWTQGEPDPELKEDEIAREDELSVFRSQWQRELDTSPSPQRMVPQPAEEESEKEMTEEERAKQLFLRGVDMERTGKLYEAIQHYKRAMQILPDVETRLYEGSEHRADTPEVEAEPEPAAGEQTPLSEDEDAVPGEEFLARMRRLVARRGRLCEPAAPHKGLHISSLPYEVVVLVARWAVSSALDACALERLGAACRGLYVLAREPQLWRALCVKTWGIDCGTPRAHGYDSWRQMYIDRPRLNLHGCYISKTTYLRHGENSFQDHFYRPWYLVDYYRYLRFFPDGVVLWWTTAEEPAACVGQLKHRAPRPAAGLMLGHYRLMRDKVVIVIKKTNSEKKPAQSSNTRFRSRRKEVVENHEQTFHLELEVRGVRGRRNWQLVWRRYAVSARRECRDQWTHFELSRAQYPPFAFSRVRNYTAESHAPLPHSHALAIC